MNYLLTILISSIMASFMPKLPYANNALEPVVSEQTIDYHYGKHLQAYVNNLEKFIKGTDLENRSIEEIVALAPEGPVYNNAGQVFNHQLYFLQFAPTPRTMQPEGKLAKYIERDFGSFEDFKKKMNDASVALFGSGWVWLCENREGGLEIMSCPNGDNPLRHGLIPLLGFDVWEHAYYLDYKNKRADHINDLWKIINWDVVNDRVLVHKD